MRELDIKLIIALFAFATAMALSFAMLFKLYAENKHFIGINGDRTAENRLEIYNNRNEIEQLKKEINNLRVF